MEDYTELWDNYAIAFCKKLVDDVGNRWNALDEDEQEIAALWKLLVDMYNGGFAQFFCNWGFECYWYAMRGLQRMGSTTLLQLLHRTYQTVFKKFQTDARIKAYWDIPRYLTEEDEKQLAETDNTFYNTEGEPFAKLAYQFYCVDMKKMV